MATSTVTLIPFVRNPTAVPPFQQIVTLDGQNYLLAVAWNIYRGDWYITLANQNGGVVLNQPLIGSPQDQDIPLAPGMFVTSTIVYRVGTGNFEITP